MSTPLFMETFGKLQPAIEIAANSVAGSNLSCRKSRLFTHDAATGLRFLIDSGADVSVIPVRNHDKNTSNDFKLFAANGTPIPTYGIKTLNIDLGLRREFRWPFVVAQVSKGILGADFLS